MKTSQGFPIRFVPLLALLSLIAFAAAPATPAAAVKEQAPVYTRATENHIYGQQIVNDLMKRHGRDVTDLVLFAVPPGQKRLQAVASNTDVIGEAAIPLEEEVVESRMTLLRPHRMNTARFNVKTPLYTSSGSVIGMIKIVLRYDPKTEDEVEMHHRAIVIREAVAKRLPDLGSLFEVSH